MEIKTLADRLIRRHESNDPFRIAADLGIHICYEPLGTIRGYYSRAWRQKFIHINNDLPVDIVPFVCAHELGHALLHPNASTPFLRANTLLSVNRLEIEANRFAACLLLSDADIIEYAHCGYTTAQVSACTGLPEILVQYRADTCPALNGVG